MNAVLERVWNDMMAEGFEPGGQAYRVYLEMGKEIQRLEKELGDTLSEPDEGYRPNLDNAAVGV